MPDRYFDRWTASEQDKGLIKSLERNWFQVILLVALLGSSIHEVYNLAEKDFILKFNHQPELGLVIKDGAITIGLSTDSSQLEAQTIAPYQCGRSEILELELDTNRHPTDRVKWAGITWSAGVCHSWGWYDYPGQYDVLPPRKK